MDDALYWMWLAQALGPGAEVGALLAEFGCARAVYEALREYDFSLLLPAGRAERLLAGHPAEQEPLLESCIRSRITVLTPEDSDYPARLLALPDLPLVLYVTGSTACLNGGRYVGMVGTRRPTAYGVQVCRSVGAGLAQRGVTIVSGLADGLDSEGHRAAVQEGAPTIGFLGTPIQKTYPVANRALRRAMEQEVGGAVVSEFSPEYIGKPKSTFLLRNRLIAGMSEALCVAEARMRSGTMNTVSHAKRYGRSVFAAPGSIFSPVSEGTNALLAEGGAQMLRSAADVLRLLDPDSAGPDTPGQETAKVALSPQAEAVRAALGGQPRSVDELCAACALPAQKVLAALTELEIAGAAQAVGGRRYVQG